LPAKAFTLPQTHSSQLATASNSVAGPVPQPAGGAAVCNTLQWHHPLIQTCKCFKLQLLCYCLQDPYRSQLEALLSAHVLPAFGSPYGHLRAKAAWLAKEFADISFSEGGSGAGPLFNTLLQQVINCLHDRCAAGWCMPQNCAVLWCCCAVWSAAVSCLRTPAHSSHGLTLLYTYCPWLPHCCLYLCAGRLYNPLCSQLPVRVGGLIALRSFVDSCCKLPAQCSMLFDTAQPGSSRHLTHCLYLPLRCICFCAAREQTQFCCLHLCAARAASCLCVWRA
jgi:hypothetical protein